MLRIFKHLLAVGILIIGSSLPAFSQSLAREIGAEYFSAMRDEGATVLIGSETESVKSVEWRDISIISASGAKVHMAFVRATEIGDGRVSMTYPEILRSTRTTESGGRIFDRIITQKNLKHIVSGEAGARRYEFGTDYTSLKMANNTPKFEMEILFHDTLSSSTISGGALNGTIGTGSGGKVEVSYALTINNTVHNGQLTFDSFDFEFEMEDFGERNAEEYIRGGSELLLSIALGKGKHTVAVNQPNFSGIFSSSSENSVFGVSLQNGQFRLDAFVRKSRIGIHFSDLPLLPMQASLNSWRMAFEMPLSKSDTATPLLAEINLDRLIASDTVWGLIDPGSILPRDAASLNLDTTMSMRWLIDTFDLEDTEKLSALRLIDKEPVVIESITVREVSLEVAGALLQGQAFLDVKPNQSEAVGTAEFSLKGGVGLLDKLVEIGLVELEQSKMAKMFSGMFALPGGDGEDHLVTKVDLKEGGSIFVNGQQIK